MPVLRGSSNEMVIQPEGDILFGSTGVGGDGRAELIIAQPGDSPGTGAPGTHYIGKSTDEIGTLVRIRLTLPQAVIVLRQLSSVMESLCGFDQS